MPYLQNTIAARTAAHAMDRKTVRASDVAQGWPGAVGAFSAINQATRPTFTIEEIKKGVFSAKTSDYAQPCNSKSSDPLDFVGGSKCKVDNRLTAMRQVAAEKLQTKLKIFEEKMDDRKKTNTNVSAKEPMTIAGETYTSVKDITERIRTLKEQCAKAERMMSEDVSRCNKFFTKAGLEQLFKGFLYKHETTLLKNPLYGPTTNGKQRFKTTNRIRKEAYALNSKLMTNILQTTMSQLLSKKETLSEKDLKKFKEQVLLYVG